MSNELILILSIVIIPCTIGLAIAYVHYLRQRRATGLQDVSKGVTTDKVQPYYPEIANNYSKRWASKVDDTV